MQGFLTRLLSSDGFMPHGHCYLWLPEVVWLHVVADGLVALSYTTIPFTLAYFVRKRRDLPFTWMFQLFGFFIIACGATHYMAIYTLWRPVYWLSGLVKALTAVASVPTAYLLLRLVPRALAIPSPADLQRANRELSSATRDVEAANRRLAASNAELEAFSYSVAHDLRAPLRAMSGFAAILLADSASKFGEDEQDCLREISDNAERMGRLIDGLLLLSRVTRTSLASREVDLTALAQESLLRLAAREPHRQVEFGVQADLRARADAALIRALLDNLLTNAWKFTGATAHATINVGAEIHGGEVVYFVCDNGAGFDPQYAQRMFSPFQRFHSEDEFAGTGIGLATVQRIVHRHGGRVWAEGEVGRGATFYFTLGESPEEVVP